MTDSQATCEFHSQSIENLARVVGAAVVHGDHFEIGIVLAEQRADTGFDAARLVLGGDNDREMPLASALEDESSSTSHRDALARELHALASRLPQDDLATAVQVLRGLAAKAREEGTLLEQ